jgi:uncharacterized repeat protein (TIGR01451 family)
MPYGNTEIISWSLGSPLYNDTGSTQYITSTFRVRFTGVDLSGVPVYASATDWNQYRDPRAANNEVRIYWYLEEEFDRLRERSDGVDGGIGIIQPLLVDPRFLPEKQLVGGGPIVEGGELLTYTMRVHNTGRAPAYDVVISDRLPSGVQVASYEATMFNPWSGATYPVTFSEEPIPGDTGLIGWTVDEIEASNNSPDQPTLLLLTYTLRILDNVGAGAELINSAWIVDYSSLPGAQPIERHYNYLPGVGQPVSSDAVDVSEPAVLKRASETDVPIGGLVVFTITVPDADLGATLYNAVVTDTLPASPAGAALHVVDAQASHLALLTVSDDTVSASAPVIPAHTQATLVITARVPVTAVGGILQNQAEITWDDAPVDGQSHQLFSNPVELTIVAPDLSVSKEAPTSAPPGNLILYTLQYENKGTAVAENARLTDTLPLHVTVVQSRTNRPVTPAAGFPDPLAWQLGALGPGEQGTIWLTATIDAEAPLGGSLVNTATVGTSSAGDNPVDNQATATTLVSGPVLEISKTAAPDPVAPDSQLSYTLTVMNVGNLEAAGVVITDRVPTSTTFQAASAGGALGVDDVVRWRAVNLSPGAQRVVTFSVHVDSLIPSGTLIINDAYGVAAGNAASPPVDPIAVTVHSRPVLRIDKRAALTVDSGEQLVYTIDYQNTGNTVAHNAWILESYDPNVTFVEADPPPDQDDNVWLLSSLMPGSDHTIVITVEVDLDLATGTRLVNLVTINSDETDPENDTVFTFVGAHLTYMPLTMKGYQVVSPPTPPNLVVQSVEVSPQQPTAGETTRISVTLHNAGGESVTDDFWVDLYVDPEITPTINVLWSDIAPYGKAWFVYEDIPGGGSITLHTDQPDDPNNPGDMYSNWPGWFVSAGEHVLFVQVDSYGSETGYVLEGDETDNVSGPTSVTVLPGDGLTAPPPPVLWQERR